jgi:hypothetical protein
MTVNSDRRILIPYHVDETLSLKQARTAGSEVVC